MSFGKTFALTTLLMVGTPGLTAAQSPADPADCTHLPLNIRADRALVPIIEQALSQSPTIRRQCQTIAGVASVRVDVHLRSGRLIAGARAEGRIVRYEFGAITAEIFIPVCVDQMEMLAHEFEHVIEQIDGVNLAHRSEVRGSGVSRLSDGAFETTRAKAAGRAAAQELAEATSPCPFPCRGSAARRAK